MTPEDNIPEKFDIKSYEYEMPEELIAQKPADSRTKSRLLVLDKNTGEIEESKFFKIGEFLRDDDLIVYNNTKVIPARLFGTKEKTGAKIELLLTKNLGENRWECLSRPAKRLKHGVILLFTESEDIVLRAEIKKKLKAGRVIVEFDRKNDFMKVLDRVGHMPLPPYIDRKDKKSDRQRYQTVYAKSTGAVAAPTAGLHFDENLIEMLKKRGIEFAEVTLHVGIGTFKPIDVQDIRTHKMHSEFYTISKETAEKINQYKNSGKRIIAVGTTSVRTLETSGFPVRQGEGETDIFIYPPYNFQVVDGLITNFHLPGSSLTVMVSAFASREKILKAYRYAIDQKFRFYSYGDAMFIK